MDKKILMPYSTAFAIRNFMGKFAIVTYDELEILRAKTGELDKVKTEFQEACGGDQNKANEIFQTESELSQQDFAYLTKDEFKQVIFQRGFDLDQVLLLEYWLVKLSD